MSTIFYSEGEYKRNGASLEETLADDGSLRKRNSVLHVEKSVTSATDSLVVSEERSEEDVDRHDGGERNLCKNSKPSRGNGGGADVVSR